MVTNFRMDTLLLKESVKSTATSLMRLLPVRAERELRIQYYRRRVVEPEILLLPEWCPRDKVAIDAGANRGDYALALSRIARRVHCFEPNPGLADELRRLFRGLPVTVEAAGLGDEVGELELNIPFVRGKELHGWASLDQDFTGREWNGRPILGVRKERVPVWRLDDLEFGDVGFIKIDVEGHEFSVLRGAEKLLGRDRPNLLIEIEQRHHARPIGEIFSWLAERGYRGSFLDEGEQRDLAEFSVETHQLVPESPEYRNNFYFTPAAA